MRKLIIRNFGPIKNIEIIIRDINIFIGTPSGNKTIVARIIAIFQGASIKTANNLEEFVNLLAGLEIDFEIKNKTVIRFEHDDSYFEIKQRLLNKSSHSESGKLSNSQVYIPAERMLSIHNRINLPKHLLNFGDQFEKARSSIKNLSIGFLKVVYENNNNTDYITISDNLKIRLTQALDGLQSVIPMIMVIEYCTSTRKYNTGYLVIEEPELNLCPVSQKNLIEYIIRVVNLSNIELIFTTNSPYILTAIDNLIQAQNVVDRNQSVWGEVDSLVPSPYWINFDKVSCYYFDEGKCRSTLDLENHSIGPSNIDDVSTQISDTFEKLLLLKYPS